MRSLVVAAAAVAVLGLGLGVSADAAGFGKPGLWQLTIKNKSGGPGAMPDASKLTPQMRAAMKAQGIDLSGGGGTITTKFCMTPADVAASKLNLGDNGDCKPVNVKWSANKYSADVVCSGRMKGKGHVEFTFPSPDRYFGFTKMDIVEDGHPVHQEAEMNARWLGAACGKIK